MGSTRTHEYGADSGAGRASAAVGVLQFCTDLEREAPLDRCQKTAKNYSRKETYGTARSAGQKPNSGFQMSAKPKQIFIADRGSAASDRLC
jgi:hypothetical protein